VSDTPADSMTSRLRRNEPRREPATIDLSATEVRPESEAELPPASSETSPESTAEAAGASEPSARLTPDEVIPSDDPNVFSPDPTLSSALPGGSTTVPPSPPAEPRRRGPGFAALLTAGLIGGLLGAGASILAETWWRPHVAQVDARLAQLEQRAAATPPSAAGPLESRMSRLETDTKALADRLNATQALAERSAKDAQEALNRPREETPPAAESAASATVLADLATRLAALEKQAQERTQAATTIQERVASIQEYAQTAANAAQALERRVADQDQRFAALAKQFSERGPDAMAASLRLTLSDRLGDALQDGAPLGQILAMLGRLDVKPDSLRSLEPYAKTGAPSTSALAQEFRPIGQRMIVETRTSADWGERVWRMLDKVVTVRAVGDPTSTDVASLVARIEDALSRDAVADATAAWDALPEAARGIAPDWGAKLKQRAAAEAAAQTIYMQALSALEAATR
jgi:hypothetical protein